MHAHHDDGKIVLSGEGLEPITIDYEQAKHLRNELGAALVDLVCAQALSRSDDPAPITQLSRGNEIMVALERADAEELGLVVSGELGVRCENPSMLTSVDPKVARCGGCRVRSYAEAKVVARRRGIPMWVLDGSGHIVAVNLHGEHCEALSSTGFDSTRIRSAIEGPTGAESPGLPRGLNGPAEPKGHPR